MIELRQEVQEFAEWVELQLRDQEVKCAESGRTPPELVRVEKHHTCLTGIGIACTNPTGSEVLGEVRPTKETTSLIY